MIIVPALLARDIGAFTLRLKALAKHVSMVQLDVVDNSMIAGTTIADPALIESFQLPVHFEVHLMVDLSKYDLMQWRRPWVERIIVHIESEGCDLALPLIRSWGIEAVLASNPTTHHSKFESLLHLCDGVMFMTVEPGNMGNAFRHDVIEGMAAFHRSHPDIPIEVDGGVTPTTIKQLINAGATRCAVGSFIDSEHVGERIQELKDAAGA